MLDLGCLLTQGAEAVFFIGEKANIYRKYIKEFGKIM